MLSQFPSVSSPALVEEAMLSWLTWRFALKFGFAGLQNGQALSVTSLVPLQLSHAVSTHRNATLCSKLPQHSVVSFVPRGLRDYSLW